MLIAELIAVVLLELPPELLEFIAELSTVEVISTLDPAPLESLTTTIGSVAGGELD